MGVVGSSGGAIDITALGDVPNVAARLASLAAPGELIISEATREAAGLAKDGLIGGKRDLKGRTEPIQAFTLRMEDELPSPGA
jgi:class 3 adenylate cyclase